MTSPPNAKMVRVIVCTDEQQFEYTIKSPMAGTLLSRLLSRLGITKHRWRRFKQWLGLSPQCGCAKREAWLNRLWR